MQGRFTVLLFTIMLSVQAFAQTETRTLRQTVSLELHEVLTIEMSQDNLRPFVFNTEKAYKDGVAQENACTFKVRGNTDWTLSWEATSPYFTGSQGHFLPASVLEIGHDNNFSPLTASRSNGVNGNRGSSAAAGNTFNLSYRANPEYASPKDSYSIDVMYTISPK